MESSLIIIFMEKELINGLMEESIQVIGERIKCMAGVFSNGQMVGDTKANTLMIRRKVMEHLNGQTVKNILDNGRMVNSMAKDNL